MLLSESTRGAFDPAADALSAPLTAGAGAGLMLDVLLCLPALLVLTRRAFDKDYQLIRSWAHLPMALLAAWAAVSPLWAADKFASVVSASHLAAALVLLWSSSQLIRSWLGLRVIGGVCLGLLLALCITGYYYRLTDYRELKQAWLQNTDGLRDKTLAARHLEPGSFGANMFAGRVLAGQPMGYSNSTNTYAALLVLLGVVSAGSILQRAADRDHVGWMILPAAAIVAAIPLIHWTQCRAAYVTPILAGIILLAAWDLRRQLARPRWARTAYFAGVAALAAITFAIIHHGLRYRTLWHDSLSFRWNYWVGSWRILTHGLAQYPRRYFHFLAGVGWENFGPFYLGHRLPAAAEEIRDPHNFIVRVFVELGMIGGLLLLAWMLRLWWELTRPMLPGGLAPNPPRAPAGASFAQGSHARKTALWTIFSIAIIAITVNIFASIDLTTDGWLVFLELLRRMLFACALVMGLSAAALRLPVPRGEKLPAGELDFELDDRPAPWVLYAMLAALATFLIHNLIEFSLFEPGPLCLFALITGSALGVRRAGKSVLTQRASVKPKLIGRTALAVGGLAWLAALALIAAPIASAEGLAHDADADARAAAALREPHAPREPRPPRRQDLQRAQTLDLRAAQAMRQAFARVPYNAQYIEHAAEFTLAAGPLRDPAPVKAMLDAAIAADPSSASNFQSRAQFELFTLRDYDAARRDYRRALALDPNNVRLRMQFAGALKELSRRLHRPDYAAEAALEFDQALSMNDQLSREEVKRLTPTELAQVRQALSELGETNPNGPSTTRPSSTRRDRMGAD